ncbi:MAG TPA: helix-turn-helix domain-containing protein [Longimicrobiaceae bacterium]|nr:helix-turn-helix domain-containing protein [Longimicrobiaceae bacterium]
MASDTRFARPLFILHTDPVLRERVHRVGGDRFDCVDVGAWDTLIRLLGEAPLTALAVVDPYSGSPGRRELAPQLQVLLSRYPSVTVLAALEIRPGRFHDLRTLGEWGVSEIIALDRDETTESIARKIRSAQGRLMRSFLAHSLPSFVSSRGRAVLLAAAELAAHGGQGSDLAESLHLSERALLRWCERSHLPAPRRLLAWVRVLFAAELLDYPDQTVLGVAHTSGYATDSSLRRAMQEFTGATPTELRRVGAFAAAADAFLSELLRLREEAKPRAAPPGGDAGGGE